MTGPVVSFEHLYRLSDDTGVFEHAKLTEPRVEHGYCLDDVARGLIVAVREPEPPDELVALAQTYLRFIIAAQTPDGRFHNRRRPDLGWGDEASVEDCWGRALWGLGTAVALAPELAAQSIAAFDGSVRRRSPWPRSMAFAAMGAAEVLLVQPDHAGARALLADAATLIGPCPADNGWRWPEPRLHYANAILPETLIAAGALLHDPRTLSDGLAMLGWLLEVETQGNHLSVTPVGGWSADEPRPAFDQQPIEVAALADACARAFRVTGELRWRDAVQRSAAWFLGENDAQIPLYDPVSCGGCDGLEADGRNANQGAESTLALISTLQQANRMLARRGR
jgi:hypothetical protein